MIILETKQPKTLFQASDGGTVCSQDPFFEYDKHLQHPTSYPLLVKILPFF